MYLLIIYLPFISFFMNFFFGFLLTTQGVMFISLSSMFLSTLIAYYIMYEILISRTVVFFSTISWFDIDFFSLKWSFLFDFLTAGMLIIILTISFLVHFYSFGYMSSDPHLNRFISYLSLFTWFMLLLVTADNYLQMFVGWEGVGLASYLLISFWNTRVLALKAALKAMLMNRVGDFALFLAFMFIYNYFYSMEYSIFFCLPVFHDLLISFNIDIYFYSFNILFLVTLLIFFGAVAKSAQIGLHTWLPDAMEGPTPVSALIHAATMVTAGVFIILRNSCIFETMPDVLWFISIVGSLTAFFGATVAAFQTDIKKIIAYSTCSQLGYMVLSCGLSNYSVAFFHLINHAFFKALLFLAAGVIIHALYDEQDMRKMGGLLRFLPFTYLMILTGSLAITGFPFLTGFYSKDLLLELAYINISVSGSFCYFLAIVSAFLTSFYSFKLIYFVFINKPTGYRNTYIQIHEGSDFLLFPLLVLFFGSIFFGFIFSEIFVGFGTDSSFFSLSFTYSHINFEFEFLPSWIKNLPLVFSIFGFLFLVYLLFFFKNDWLRFIRFVGFYFNGFVLEFFSHYVYNFGVRARFFFMSRWYFDYLYNYFISLPIMRFSYNLFFKILDRGFLEYYGPMFFFLTIRNFYLGLFQLQSGFLFTYFIILCLFLLWCVNVIVLLFLWV